MRRPGGGPLISQRVVLGAGDFTRTTRVVPAVLPRGAKLLPGAFVVSLRGTSGGAKLPLQLQALVLDAPREGVVRQAFVTATEAGPKVLRLPSVPEAWAHFRMAAQAVDDVPLSVRWYYPDGRVLGTAGKSNRPEITSFIRSATPLPSGAWVAELRAGDTIIQRLSVRIG
jgi:hypothetical protein